MTYIILRMLSELFSVFAKSKSQFELTSVKNIQMKFSCYIYSLINTSDLNYLSFPYYALLSIIITHDYSTIA